MFESWPHSKRDREAGLRRWNEHYEDFQSAGIRSEGKVVLKSDTTFERHFTVGELAKLWHLNRETVRQLVQHEDGVVRVRRGSKKARTHYSVPESVARRLHNKLDDPATELPRLSPVES